MYPRITWELVTDPKGSAEHTFRTTRLCYPGLWWIWDKKRI